MFPQHLLTEMGLNRCGANISNKLHQGSKEVDINIESFYRSEIFFFNNNAASRT